MNTEYGPMINYVAYDENGNLIGGFLQEIQPAHAGSYIVVTEEQRLNWFIYRANAARDGIELIPAPDPTDPTDPEPEN